MNDLSEAVEQLTRTVADLQRRVGVLESAARPQPSMPALPARRAVALPLDEPQRGAAGNGALAIFGKAMLAIAGAYLFRALAESGAVPRIPVAAVAILYAFIWLIPASRSAARAWLASTVWAATSVLILIPMLWELSLRFRLLPGFVSAGVLAAFVVVASSSAWKHHFVAIAWVTESAASITALVLAIAMRDPAPFIVALLVMVMVGEIAAARHRTLRVRPLLAAAADLAVFALIWIYSGAPERHAEYAPLGSAILLLLGPAMLLIYAASAAAQTLLLRHKISFFEIAQTLVAFLLAVWEVLSFWSGPGAILLGILCLLASAAGYTVAFARFSHAAAQRNYHVYATGSLALLLAGCSLCLPPAGVALSLSLCAILATLVGVRANRWTLEFHGLACLAIAAYFSGSLAWVARAMTGTLPASLDGPVSLVSASSLICYFAVARTCQPLGEPWWIRLHRLLAAALAASTVAALLVWALGRTLALAVRPEVSHIAVIRTLVICAIALALAWSGAAWQRRELVWLAWAALAFGASKLLFEDLRHGRLAFTAVSLFLYAIALLLLPRLVHRTPGAPSVAG